jgi:AcrR family transcriptional regulator
VALEHEFSALYAPIGRPSITAGEAAPSDAVAGVLFNPVGTAADGPAGVRSPIPLVRRNRGRCCANSITRDRILKTAVKLFAERGYEATGIRTLAAKAHVNQAAINYHFETKDGLYREVLRAAIHALTEDQLSHAQETQAMPRERALGELGDGERCLTPDVVHGNAGCYLVGTIIEGYAARKDFAGHSDDIIHLERPAQMWIAHAAASAYSISTACRW